MYGKFSIKHYDLLILLFFMRLSSFIRSYHLSIMFACCSLLTISFSFDLFHLFVLHKKKYLIMFCNQQMDFSLLITLRIEKNIYIFFILFNDS